MNSLKTVAALLLLINFISCDEELTPRTYDDRTQKEKLLIREWTYDYILMDADTIRALTRKGEPQTSGIFEATNQYYRLYDADHRYEFRWEEGSFFQNEYGAQQNYQPNLGYWHLSENGEVLIHNSMTSYEKQFEILELTDQTLRLKLIGDRTSFLTNGNGVVEDIITGTWIEVFIPRVAGN